MSSPLFAEKEIVVFDTEYTAWEGSQKRHWSGPNEYREIVQIGAVKIRTDDLAELSNLVIFVKPEKNPVLSPFFTALTGITQHEIETEGIGFAEAVKRFRDWCGELAMYCWGSDAAVMQANAELLKIKFPFESSRFRDARTVFWERGIPAERYHSSTIIEFFGQRNENPAHNGLNDARAIVAAMRELKSRK